MRLVAVTAERDVYVTNIFRNVIVERLDFFDLSCVAIDELLCFGRDFGSCVRATLFKA